MPPPTTSNPMKRKGPTFQPPRQVKPPAPSTATSKPAKGGSKTSAARTSTSARKSAASRPSFQSATNLISSSSPEQDDADGIDDEDEEMEDEDVNATQRRPGPSTAAALEPAASQDTTRPAIPPNLLARLLHEGFEDKDMKIQKEAMSVVGKYMETFVREAIARAAFEREDAERGGGISDGFLQVEDLEKLAPQLVLDF
ncbi:hypothetical protein K432DRAFT_350681 [Lepidopterella palustris CBS 459.81]|uniref:Centromere protein X n=1 Tax=Lepidopterella palustris CBS 459.81 TaxID=1314670 RepID=A0A8E2JGZ2_9PEZI|nr:hypothetical protein K432DRAFT_350681 [Lepidopterella palustris CBS 459.81]